MAFICPYSSRQICHLWRYFLITRQIGPCHSVCSRFNHQWHVSSMFPGATAVLSGPRAAADGREPDCEMRGTGSLSQRHMLRNSLIRGGGAIGTYNLLPFTMRAVEKLYRIIDREMHNIGAQKISMPCLSPAQPWRVSGRWDVIGSELFTLDDRKSSRHCLAPTHEEAVTSLVASEGIVSYKRLPIMLYQIGRKFRDEMRPKNALLRCREFEMKDLYTFDEEEESGAATYEKVCGAYDRILDRLNLKYVKVEADTGAMGGSLSHEYHLLADVGEDILYKCEECGKAFNQEVIEDGGELCQSKCTLISPNLNKVSGIEIAHAFLLGTKYSSKFKANFVDKMGERKPLYMGCYGIGVTRLVAAAIEVLSTPDHTRWPRLLVPHQVIIIPQKEGYNSDITWDLCQKLLTHLARSQSLSGEYVLDDRLNLSIGKRLSHAKQLGYPIAVIAGKTALEDPPKFEVVDIYNGQSDLFSMEQVINMVNDIENINLW